MRFNLWNKCDKNNELDHQEKFPGSNYEMSKDFQNLCQELKQERTKSFELFKELEDTKMKMKEWEKMQIEKQKQDSFETMIVLIEHILEEMVKSNNLSYQQKANWEDYVGALLNDYQDDVKLLQEKYLQQLWVLYSKRIPKIQIIEEEFLKINPKLNIYLNVVNQEEREDNSNDNEDSEEDIDYDIQASALRVIEDIEKRQIFDDIRIDFDSIVDNIAPEDNPSRLNQMLVSYYEEIHEVLQKRLDEWQDIIEEYMTQLIESKRKQFQKQMESIALGEGELTHDFKFTANNKIDISSITSEHNKRLSQLREQYEEFLKNTEIEFFNVLKAVKGNSDLNSEINEESNETSIIERSKQKDDKYSEEVKLSTGDSRRFSKEIYSQTSTGTENKNIKPRIEQQNDNKNKITPSNTVTKREISITTPKFTGEQLIHKQLDQVEYNISDEKDENFKLREEEIKIAETINFPLKIDDSKNKFNKRNKNEESKDIKASKIGTIPSFLIIYLYHINIIYNN